MSNENSEKIVTTEELHDERGKFKEGHPRVGGQRKGGRWLSTMLQEALLEPAFTKDGEHILDREGKPMNVAQVINQVVARKAMSGDNTMIGHAFDRLEGKAKENITLKGELSTTQMTLEEKKDLLRLLRMEDTEQKDELRA